MSACIAPARWFSIISMASNIVTDTKAFEAPAATSAAAEATRFLLECEFVQLLADPAYVQYIVQQHLHKDGFEAYLAYLLGHWSTLAYARHLRWPQGLVHLRLLVFDKEFRAAAAREDFCAELREGELHAWRTRAAEADALVEAAVAAAAGGAAAAPRVSLASAT